MLSTIHMFLHTQALEQCFCPGVVQAQHLRFLVATECDLT